MRDHGMCVGNGDGQCVNTECTWFSGDFRYSSKIDYAIVTKDLDVSANELVILDTEVWNSDHIPVMVSIPFVWNQQLSGMKDKSRRKAGKSLAWCHAGTEQLANYSERLGILLDEVCVLYLQRRLYAIIQIDVNMGWILQNITRLFFMQFSQLLRPRYLQ